MVEDLNKDADEQTIAKKNIFCNSENKNDTNPKDLLAYINTQQYEKQKKNYNKFVESITPQTGIIKSLLQAFLVGGLTCIIGQLLLMLYGKMFPSVEKEQLAIYMLITLIFISILFTGLGFYDKIARIGGAGSFLPITGFANAMSSASMEFKTEGLVFGTSVKMFSIVGPVIVNGVFWSAVFAIIRYFVLMII